MKFKVLTSWLATGAVTVAVSGGIVSAMASSPVTATAAPTTNAAPAPQTSASTSGAPSQNPVVMSTPNGRTEETGVEVAPVVTSPNDEVNPTIPSTPSTSYDDDSYSTSEDSPYGDD